MLQLVDDPSRINHAVRLWRSKLADADGNIKLAPDIRGAVRDTGEQVTINLVRLSGDNLKASQISSLLNIPVSGVDENVLGAVGVDASGRQWILRQGFLRPNGELKGVELHEFEKFTTLEPVEVEPRPCNPNRHYYAVACVDGLAEEVHSETTAFVQECAWVRRRKYGLLVPGETGVAALSKSIRLAEGALETRLSTTVAFLSDF